MKTESIFALLVIAILGYFGYDYLKKQQQQYGNSTANQISAAVGTPAIVPTENSQIGWQIPGTQPTFMQQNTDLVGEFPSQAL